MIFKKVISLGPSCQTAYQIREVVDQEEAYVFDWLIAPASRVADVLNRRFASFINADALRFVQPERGDAFIVDHGSGLEFHHDFRNDPNFMETLGAVEQKYSFIISRMLALLESESAVLFVHDSESAEEPRRLDEALRRQFPKLNYRLLSILDSQRTFDGCGDTDTVHFRTIEKKADATWQELSPHWRSVLVDVLGPSIAHGSITLRHQVARSAA